MYQDKTVVVTGANGLLGYEVISNLKEKNQVIALVRNIPKEKVQGIDYIAIDLSTDWNIDLLPKKANAILHLAQSPHFREFPNMALDVFNVNVASTAKLLDYARAISSEHFVYASSGGVYGTGATAFTENSAISTTDKLGYYLGSKLCGEILTNNYSPYIYTAVLRIFFMYGQRQQKHMLIPRLIDNIKNGRPITLAGDEGIRLNPIHVNDVTRVLNKVLELNKSLTVNIAGSEVTSVKKISQLIGDLVGKRPVFEITSDHSNDLVADCRFMRDYKIEAKTTLEQGIKQLLL